MNKIIEIERNDNEIIEKELFYSYIKRNQPIVFSKLASNWKAIKKWTPDYLIESIGHDYTVSVNKCSFGGYYKDIIQMKFSEFIRKSINKEFDNILDSNDNKIKKTNKAYLRNFEMFDDFPIFNQDVDIEMMFDSNQHNMIVKRTFIGSTGSATSLHIDTGDNLVSVIKGCKYIIMIPPSDSNRIDFEKSREVEISYNENEDNGIQIENHPAFFNCNGIYKTLLKKGESLFIPLGWLHYIHNIQDNNSEEDHENSLVISVSCWGKNIYDLVT